MIAAQPVTIQDSIVQIEGQFDDRAIMDAHCLGFQVDQSAISLNMQSTSKKALAEYLHRHLKDWVLEAKKDKDPNHPARIIGKYYQDRKKKFMQGIDAMLNYPQNLYGFQKETLFETHGRKVNILGSDMGIGKSVMSASYSKINGVGRTIIVCPTQLKWNWFHELSDKWGYEQIYISVLDRRRAHSAYAFLTEEFVIVNYEQVSKFFKYLTKDAVGHIIADEVHKCKNPSTDRSKNLVKLIQAFPEASITPMSGTLITNRINDLFGYLKATDHTLGRNHSYFMDRYVRKHKGKITGAKNIAELKFRLSNSLIRIKAEECLELPPLNIVKSFFMMDDVTDDYKEQLDQLKKNDQKLRRIASQINEIEGKHGRKSQEDKQRLSELKHERFKIKGMIQGNIFTMCRITAISKVKKVCDLVDGLIKEGNKVIIFSTYHDPMDLLEDYYRARCVRIDGSVDSLSRDRKVQQFLHDDHCKVFIGQNSAAGVGINLVNSNHVVFMDMPITPDNLEQPYKRAHRIGQTKQVNVYYTIAKHTIDERVYDLIRDKVDDIIEILDKGKKGVIHYETLEEKLVKDLIKSVNNNH